jgi:hypothetical protein
MEDNNNVHFDESTAGIASIYVGICLAILIGILIFG